MTDDKHYEFLEELGNDHSLARGGGIVVQCSAGHTSMMPLDKDRGCRYEDGNLLHDQLSGANSFLFWLRRNGYDIVQKKVNIKKG